MILDELIRLFERDIERLKVEINAYTKEENLWKVEHNITNSAGNLCLHLVGNMRLGIIWISIRKRVRRIRLYPR